MKLRTLLKVRLNNFIDQVISSLIIIQVRLSGGCPNLPRAIKFLKLISFVFRTHLRKSYYADAAEFLTNKVLDVSQKDFVKFYLQNKLTSLFVRTYLERSLWPEVTCFLQSNSRISTASKAIDNSNMLLVTHTGDYWVAILTAAMQYEGKGCNFIVPIYEKIEEKNKALYKKIKIKGVNLIFVNIHEPGTLLRLTRYLKTPGCVVAIFYDLYCHAAGIYNGGVEAVNFANKKGFMTTGILQIIRKLSLKVSFVACEFCLQENKYIVEFSPMPQHAAEQDLRREMVDYIEARLKVRPYQWHFIANLDTYYHIPFSRIQAVYKKNQAQFLRLNAKYSHASKKS